MKLDSHLGMDRMLRGLWQECLEWCDANNIQRPRGGFSLASLGHRERPQKYPVFATYIKGAHTKTILKFLCSKVLQLHVGGDDYSELRSTCAWFFLN